MSIPFGSNVLTFSEVAKQLRTTFETFTDRRRGKNTHYTLVDAGLSAFSVFFMQSLLIELHLLKFRRQHINWDWSKKPSSSLHFGMHHMAREALFT
jgi:hypothetical protein